MRSTRLAALDALLAIPGVRRATVRERDVADPPEGSARALRIARRQEFERLQTLRRRRTAS
jgi:hypothetical protein